MDPTEPLAGAMVQPSLFGGAASDAIADGSASAATRDPTAALAALHGACGACRRCGLALGRQQVVVSRGNPAASLMVIGEGPGAQEDASGSPFVGRAGQLLDQMFASVAIDTRQDAYVCNVVKCRPPDNRKPTPEEMAACLPWLLQQIELVQPKVLVLAGATAMEVLGLKGDHQAARPVAAMAGAVVPADLSPFLSAAQSIAGAQHPQMAHLAGPPGRAPPPSSAGGRLSPAGRRRGISWSGPSDHPSGRSGYGCFRRLSTPVAGLSVAVLGPVPRPPAPMTGTVARPQTAPAGLPADWASNPRYDTVITRRKTRSVRVGDVWVGSDHPVVVQSMINEDTLDIAGATAGIRRLHEAGCEIVRLTVPSLGHARAVGRSASASKTAINRCRWWPTCTTTA